MAFFKSFSTNEHAFKEERAAAACAVASDEELLKQLQEGKPGPCTLS